MSRFFNTTGPCLPGKHYLLPASSRCQQIFGLFQREQYFVIHAARQTGKTTLLGALAKELNAGGQYYALYCSLESVQSFTDPKDGMPAIYRSIVASMQWIKDWDIDAFTRKSDPSDINNGIKLGLSGVCAALDRPLILLIDEIDCLANGTLITFLRQLRDGYISRSIAPFPHSCALVGMRNIRDYKARLRGDRDTLGSASPFNIAAEALTLHNFTEAEVGELYAQHTADTGQPFTAEAVARAWWWSRGQPWLVNALADQVVHRILADDTSRTVLPEYFDQAAEILIERRDTHIDSLIERLREERVRRVVEPVLIGSEPDLDLFNDDARYVLDLGLLTREHGEWQPSNPIYREVIMRVLSYTTQATLSIELQNRWIADGRLDMNALLKEFQIFWRENSEIWLPKYDYREAAPHLILQAYLQRVLNGGAMIDREFALGRQRLDLCIRMGDNRYPLEVKLRELKRADPVPLGLRQLGAYMDRCGASEGWLVIFDRRPRRSWKQRISWKTVTAEARTIHVVGC
jgi:hypothetical protein